MTVIFGVGHYVEITFGGRFAEKYPYLIYIGVTVILSVLLLPILIRVVVNIFDILPSGKTLIWKFIWIIPTVFFVLCMTTGNILMGTGAVTSIFVTVRVIMGAGMVVTCYLFARALRYEMRNAELIENARMMQNQLKLQHEQYAGLMKNVETEKNARHDLRHQLAVLKGYGADGDLDKLNGYLEKLVGNLPVSKAVYCENYAVNAVVNHHLSALNSEDIKLDIKLDIPEDTGNVSAMDLCVMIGNFFENAVHACRRVKVGEKFIRVRSRVDGKTLSVTVENSFGGLWHYDDKNGVYLSMKENSAENIPREGVGLSSVKAVCEKYNGSMRIEIENKVWKAAGLVYMK
jgi:sensor histidine kinase regulating citrate/malate metabolism